MKDKFIIVDVIPHPNGNVVSAVGNRHKELQWAVKEARTLVLEGKYKTLYIAEVKAVVSVS